MTVCIVASCEHGKSVVAATDGALSYGGITAEIGTMKAWFFDDWLFLYSGEPSSAELIAEDMQLQAQADKECLDRSKIGTALHRAFRRRISRWSSDAILSPFDLDMDEFKKEGLDLFGEKVVAEMMTSIRDRAQNFSDQILMVGWGASGLKPLIHEENWEGSTAHSFPGAAAIGSGGPTAMSQILLLGHSSNRRLEDTIYSVAAGKFAAEQAHGVGKETTMVVLWKRHESDSANRMAGKVIPPGEITKLRDIWEEHGRPRVPSARYQDLIAISEASLIPKHARSEDGAISEAKVKDFKDRLNAPLKPGETSRTTGF